MNSITSMAALSLIPWVEAKGGVLYGYYQGLPLWMIFTICVGLNLLAIPLVSFLWEKSLIPGTLRKWLEKKLQKEMIRAENWFNKYGIYTLAFFIGIPLTGLGLYSGTFVAKMMGLDRKQVYSSVALGMLMEVTITFLSLAPVINFFKPTMGLLK